MIMKTVIKLVKAIDLVKYKLRTLSET